MHTVHNYLPHVAIIMTVITARHVSYLKCFKRFSQHSQMRQPTLYHEMLSIVTVPLSQRPVLDVSAGPSFSHCGPSQQRLGAWAAEWRREAALFSSGCFHSS